MGVEESGTKEILGNEADYYRIDNYQDIYAWKGLILKNEDFATKGSNGPRSTVERAKVAIEIDTTSKVNDTIFNPTWLKREKRYQSLDYNKINALLDTRLDLLEQADNIEGIDIKKNDILLYVTTNHSLGKMQVLVINEKVITIKFEWYYNDNSLASYSELFKIKKNTLVDIDEVTTNKERTSEIDFRWENMEKQFYFQ
jgi:hypothetical protein